MNPSNIQAQKANNKNNQQNEQTQLRSTTPRQSFKAPNLTGSQQHTFLICVHVDGGCLVVAFLSSRMECFSIQNLG